MLVSRKEKDKLVIKLAEEEKSTREIAKSIHLSFRDIGVIIRKATGDLDLPEVRREQAKE